MGLRYCRPGSVVRVTRPIEAGVLVVERWILAALRHRTFFSLAELNVAIDGLLEKLNARPFKKLPGCRRAHFETLDKPALRPLPAVPYVYAEWKKARVHIDYHVEVEGHYYSVPHALIKKQLDVRITQNIIECFYRGKRVASHRRSQQKGRHTTVPAHMPESHRRAGEDHDVLAARHALYTQARAANPRRWSGATRDWTPRGAVTLNPERDTVIDAAVVSQDKQTGTA